MQFTWIPFYMKFADELMRFRNDRKPLLELIYQHRKEFKARYLHEQEGTDNLLEDIDPFTVFGLFNRNIKRSNRIESIKLLAELLHMQVDIPQDFEGIPLLNNMSSYFFGNKSHRKKDDIENLWRLFEKVINEEDFDSEFNRVIKQHAININITMGLFWIRPKEFLALDSHNRDFLKTQYGITIPDKVPDCKTYKQLLEDIQKRMASDGTNEKTFYELSAKAYAHGNESPEWNHRWENHCTNLWKRRQNLVLQGAPGTGKTYCLVLI